MFKVIVPLEVDPPLQSQVTYYRRTGFLWESSSIFLHPFFPNNPDQFLCPWMEKIITAWCMFHCGNGVFRWCAMLKFYQRFAFRPKKFNFGLLSPEQHLPHLLTSYGFLSMKTLFFSVTTRFVEYTSNVGGSICLVIGFSHLTCWSLQLLQNSSWLLLCLMLSLPSSLYGCSCLSGLVVVPYSKFNSAPWYAQRYYCKLTCFIFHNFIPDLADERLGLHDTVMFANKPLRPSQKRCIWGQMVTLYFS